MVPGVTMSECRRLVFNNSLECTPAIPVQLEAKTWASSWNSSGALFDAGWEQLPTCPVDLKICGNVTFSVNGLGTLVRSDYGFGFVDCGKTFFLKTFDGTNYDYYKGLVTRLGERVFANMSTLETLLLGANQISTFGVNTFYGMTALNRLEFGCPGSIPGSCNRISEITSNTFEGLTRLSYLDLNYNLIVTIHPDSFRSMTYLTLLALDGNLISNISSQVFFGLTALQVLNLRYNKLDTIAADAFASLASLQQLTLTGNKLTSLDPNVFSGLTSLQYL